MMFGHFGLLEILAPAVGRTPEPFCISWRSFLQKSGGEVSERCFVGKKKKNRKKEKKGPCFVRTEA